MLNDDLRALKACSLTCKAMFALTRRIIHQTLSLTTPNIQSVFTRGERRLIRRERGCYRQLELSFISSMDKHGLLQYVRQVYIYMPRGLYPESLLPRLHQFRTLNRIHTLTLECTFFPAQEWANYYEACFAHFYPTLTSLTLRDPYDNSKFVMRFALQFPNLENLCLERLKAGRDFNWDWTFPTSLYHSPPLSGRLRLAGGETLARWPVRFTPALSNGINFRTVELEDFAANNAQRVLDACAGTLENLILVLHGDGECQL